MKSVVFDSAYYASIIKAFGYDPLAFEEITFQLGTLSHEELNRFFLCHMNGGAFAAAHAAKKRVIATTGFGLSGTPHMGTLAQMLRAVRLQHAGMPVQIVLGDLDAHNGKNIPLEKTRELAAVYRRFMLRLGFRDNAPSVLRNQYDSLSTLRRAYLIGNVMDEQMFALAEEDLHGFYAAQGKVDHEMSYRRKLSLNLMIADFAELLMDHGFDAVLVFLGIDEHQYVRFGAETLRRLSESDRSMDGKHYAALYSGIIGGLNGYPKMSKSFPLSSISVDMDDSEIIDRIVHGEVVTPLVEMNVIYQMIASVSSYSLSYILEAHAACAAQSPRWQVIKHSYAIDLAALCAHWKEAVRQQ